MSGDGDQRDPVPRPPLRLAAESADLARLAAREAVARENRAAALAPDLDPTDPRWVLAVRVHAQLQGSVLTPDRRDRVMETARRLGVRPFEAGVIVAMVQDRARRGGGLADLPPSLGLLDDPRQRRPARPWLALLAAIAAALVGTALVIRWIVDPG